MGTDDELTKAMAAFRNAGLGSISGAIGKKADVYKNNDVMAPLRVPIYAFGTGLLTGFLVLASKELWWAACFPAVLLLGILCFYARVYWHWMRHDPDRLQTESYRIDSQLLGIVAEKGLPAPIAQELIDAEGVADDPDPPRALTAKKPRQLVIDAESKSSESIAKPKRTKTDREKE